MLPIIIKLLQSKLHHKKKGAVNKKSVHVRRNIVYQFLATFNVDSEFPFAINELLSPISLSLPTLSAQENQEAYIERTLSMVSFNA